MDKTFPGRIEPLAKTFHRLCAASRILFLPAALLTFTLTAPPLLGAAASIPSPLPRPSVNAEQILLAAANRERAARGISQLRFDPVLAEAARFHALQMAAHANISHQFSGEPDLSQRGASAGVHFSLISENVAEAPNASMFHAMWMNSKGHRDNLLDPKVNVVGIAIVVRNGQYYAVEDFASTVETLSFNRQEEAVTELLSHRS